MNTPPSFGSPRCSVSFDLRCLAPTECTREFSHLLGYEDEQSCLGSFSSVAHFEGHNLLQLASLAGERSNRHQLPARDVFVIDRSFRRVGRVRAISMNRLYASLKVEVAGMTPGRETGEAEAWLTLDHKFRVVSSSHSVSAHWKRLRPDTDLDNADFFEAFIPPAARPRVQSIYQRRLARYGSVRLTHLSLTSSQSVQPVDWFVQRHSDGYQVMFAPVAGWPPTNIVLDRAGRLVVAASGLQELLHIDVRDIVQEDWCWLISPADRGVTRFLLTHPDLPESHTLFYRVTGRDSVVRPVRHDLRRRGHYLAGWMEPAALQDLDKRLLNTIAMENDLSAETNFPVTLKAYPAFQQMILGLQTALRETRLDNAISIDTAQGGACSLCGAEASMAPAVRLVLRDLTLLPAELPLLLSSAASLHRLGQASPWPAVLQRCHQSGLHFCLALNDAGQVTITIIAEGTS